MEKDERLLPLPSKNNLPTTNQEFPSAYAPFYDDDSFSENRSIREYFNIVYKRLPIILTLAILTTAVVAFYMYKQPSMFSAQTDMIIEPRKPKVQQTNAVIINNYGDDMNYTNTQLKLLHSHDLMKNVVIGLGLQRNPNLFSAQEKGVVSTIKSMFYGGKEDVAKSSLPVLNTAGDDENISQTSLTPEEDERAESYADILLGGLNIEPEEHTNIVHVIEQSTNPDLAARVADKVVEVFINQDIDRETRGAKKSYEDLSKSINELNTDIESEQRSLLAMQAKSGLPLMNGKGQDVNASTLQTLSGQLLAAKDTRRVIEGDYNAAVEANSKGEIFATLGNDAAIQNVRQTLAARREKQNDRIQELNRQIQELKARKSQLLARYTEEYKDVVAVNEEIKERQDTLARTQDENQKNFAQEEAKVKNDVAKEVLTGKRANLVAAQKREAQLQNAFDVEVSHSNQQGIAETQLTTLTRGIETKRQLLDTYTQRQKEQELAIAGSRPDNIKISSRAQVPSSPIGPNRNRNIFVALLISLAAGIGLAFLLDFLDDSVKSSDDIGRHLGLPTLALIPHQNTVDKRKLARLNPKNGYGSGSGKSLALIALEDNRSAMAEAYRHLRTSLLFSSAGKPPQTILVTSSQPAEGKTTTAINSAVTLAQSGAAVVIIDCDLRRPRLHSHFGLDNVSGLTNYLSGDRNPANLIKTCEELPNLKVITSGPLPPNPAELLSSNEMKNLLQFLKGNYKHIVIDSPPAISFTDAAILSTVVDGVILVALAGKSSIQLMRRFKQRLGNIGARIYGVVLNGIKPDSVEYGYYGYGYTYDYYTPSEDDSTPLMEEEKVYAAQDNKP